MITPNCRSVNLVRIAFAVSVFLFPASLRTAPSPTPAPSGAIDEKLFNGMRWRQIGPFRGRRALAVEGVVGEPDTYYFGAVAGGVWKTTDGGANWTPLFDKAPISSIGAIAVAPSDHNVIYVGTGEAAIRGNTTYGTGVFKSIDGGKTWDNVGLKDTRQIGALIVDPRNENVVLVAALGHAFGPNQERGIFRTDDAGQHWTRVNDDGRFRQRAWYFSKVYADPKSADTVYLLNTGLFKSVDGGKTFNLMPARHGDHHGLWIDPTNPSRIANASDGGASIAHDGGKNWTTQNNQPTAQFYHVAVDNAFPYHIYGAQQDNSNVGIASRSDSGVISRENWFEAGGGECGFVVADSRDWHIIYSNSEGLINRYDTRREEVQDGSPIPVEHSGHRAGDLTHR